MIIIKEINKLDDEKMKLMRKKLVKESTDVLDILLGVVAQMKNETGTPAFDKHLELLVHSIVTLSKCNATIIKGDEVLNELM